jgi:hypothetical protein
MCDVNYSSQFGSFTLDGRWAGRTFVASCTGPSIFGPGKNGYGYRIEPFTLEGSNAAGKVHLLVVRRVTMHYRSYVIVVYPETDELFKMSCTGSISGGPVGTRVVRYRGHSESLNPNALSFDGPSMLYGIYRGLPS